MKKLIEITTSENQIVLDQFIVSGINGIAWNELKRKFIGFELLKKYYKKVSKLK